MEMVKYYVEENLRNFKAWSGAVDTLNKLIKLDRVEEVENYIEECMTEASDTDINDFLWFETDFIFMELLGLNEEEYENLF
jgi:hypothetical protein